jgi:hypothetical protein
VDAIEAKLLELKAKADRRRSDNEAIKPKQRRGCLECTYDASVCTPHYQCPDNAGRD